MAITLPELRFYKLALGRVSFPENPTVLEFGEAEVLGMPLAFLVAELADRARPGDAETFAERLNRPGARESFALARAFYDLVFRPSAYVAIDRHGTEEALALDLNEPVNLGRTFDVCINNGTSEHIFNQSQFFRTVHDHTAVGGRMVHIVPTFGWYDHGLFHPQPGLFFDLARANGYAVEILCVGSRKSMYEATGPGFGYDLVKMAPDMGHACLYTVLRRTSEAPFVLPQQGMYS